MANGLQLAGLVANTIGAVLLVLSPAVRKDIQWVGGKPAAVLTRPWAWRWGFILLLIGFAVQTTGLLLAVVR